MEKCYPVVGYFDFLLRLFGFQRGNKKFELMA
jgi:hypothetical protein